MTATCRSYDELVSRLQSAASAPSASLETIGEFDAVGRTYPVFLLRLGCVGPDKVRVMIASGIHGDEPASVEAAMRFVEENSSNERLLSRFCFTIFPCNNPTGWELDTRENRNGVDLNREFGARKPAPEVAILMRALEAEGKCFDLVFEMHEDVDAPGFYLYEIAENSTDHVGEHIIEKVASMGCPINMNPEIEGMPAKGGLIRRKTIRFRKTHVPQAIYIYRTCGGHVITLEPPVSMLGLEQRVKIELAALDLALKSALA
ncbi:MAG: M14 family metallocarboxypeptidase [Armatimonadetes bacterium]|nr:M14 family metallocarboxypeptidase [Armatimonadota bacterium]